MFILAMGLISVLIYHCEFLKCSKTKAKIETSGLVVSEGKTQKGI